MSEMDRDSLLRLDEELARMSRETPEVPADFHSRWMSAVREDAGRKEADRVENMPQPRAGEAAEEIRRIGGRKTAGGQWRRLASLAASMVILLSGVMIARNAGFLRDPAVQVQEDKQSAPAVTQTPEPVRSEAPAPVPEPAAEAYAAEGTLMTAAYEAPEAEEAYEADTAWEANEIRAEEDTAADAGEARKANGAPAADADVEVEEAAEAQEEAMVYENMAVPAAGDVQEEQAPDSEAGGTARPIWPWVALGIAGVVALILLTRNKNTDINQKKGEQKDV